MESFPDMQDTHDARPENGIAEEGGGAELDQSVGSLEVAAVDEVQQVVAAQLQPDCVLPPPPEVPREFLSQSEPQPEAPIQAVEPAPVTVDPVIAPIETALVPVKPKSRKKPKPAKRTPKNSIIPIPMENGKPAHVSPLVRESGSIVVSDFVREVLPVSEINDMLAMAMNQELNKLRFRVSHLFRARDFLMSQFRNNGAKRMLDMYTSDYVYEPRKTDMHPFTALAIARYLKEMLPRGELSFGVAVAIPPDFGYQEGCEPFKSHFVTTVSFDRFNAIGGKSIMENPKKMIFIDVSSPNKHFEDHLVIDKVSNMQNYGFRLYNQKKNTHRQNVFARRSFEKVNEWVNRDLDNYSQILFDAMTAPDKFVPFDYNPDLFAEALQTSLDHGNKITGDIRRQLLRALGVPDMLVEAIAKAVNGETKIMSGVRRQLLDLIGAKDTGEESSDTPTAADTEGGVFDQAKLDTLVAMLRLPKKYLR